ncbi:MAG: hypothetical protein GC157_15620 [Frankiales bacterium]|nr:hypothetical protein [Frankiales bacterium]
MLSGWFAPTGHDGPYDPHRRGVPHRSDEERPHDDVILLDCFGVHVVRPTLVDRLVARLTADRLDRALVAGVAPESQLVLALHARRIATESSRRRLADVLARLLEAGQEWDRTRSPGPAIAVLPRVWAARDDLAALEQALLAPAPLSARGIATVRRLLRDGEGPLYRYEATGDVGAMARDALRTLEPTFDWSV